MVPPFGLMWRERKPTTRVTKGVAHTETFRGFQVGRGVSVLATVFVVIW